MSDIPLWGYKMLLRIMQLLNQSPFVEVRIFRVDGHWYIQTGNGEPERLVE